MAHHPDHEPPLVRHRITFFLLHLFYLPTCPIGAKKMETDQSGFYFGNHVDVAYDPLTFVVGISIRPLQSTIRIDRNGPDHYGTHLYQLVDLTDRIRIEREYSLITLPSERKSRNGIGRLAYTGGNPHSDRTWVVAGSSPSGLL
jgi:hypothetical protein